MTAGQEDTPGEVGPVLTGLRVALAGEGAADAEAASAAAPRRPAPRPALARRVAHARHTLHSAQDSGEE